MSDIFISYANEDRPRAERLAEALASQGWSIFWDRTIPTGKTWREVIGAALDEARCVVVLWSEASIVSDWVHEEADEGRERNILIPVLIEAVRPPIGFRSLQTADLSNWDGSKTTTALEGLIADIAGVIGPPPVEVEREERRAEEERKRKAEEEEESKKAQAERQKRAQEEAKRKAEEEEEARQKAALEEKRGAAEAAKRETDEEARRTAALGEKAAAGAEAGSVPAAPTLSPWKGGGPAKWIMLTALALLLVGGGSYAVYEYKEQQRIAEEVGKEKAEKERQAAAREALQDKAEKERQEVERLVAEEEARRKAEEEARRRAEEEARRKAEKEARRKAEEEARRKAEEEERRKAEEEARLKAEEEARLKVEEMAQRERVREAQALLAKLGYEPGPANGIEERVTGRAVEAFKRKANLPVDPIIDDALLVTLREAARAQEEAGYPPQLPGIAPLGSGPHR